MSKRLVSLLAAIAVLTAAAWITPALARRVATSHETAKMGHAAGSVPAAAQVPLGELPRVLIGNTPQGTAIDPATSTVYVANQNSNTISVVNVRRCNAHNTTGCGQTPPSIAGGSGPFAIALDHATHTLYVADSGSDKLSVINTASCDAEVRTGCGQKPATLTVGPGQAGVIVDPATDTVYVTTSTKSGTGTVAVMNGASCNASVRSGCNQNPTTVKLKKPPFGLALDTANHTLYVNDAPENEIALINTATCHARHISGCAHRLRTAAVGNFPVAIIVDPSTNTIYVGNGNQPTVSLINGASCNATTSSGCRRHPITLHVLGGVDGLAVDDATHTLFVANNGPGNSTGRANTVSVVNAATCNARNSSGCGHLVAKILAGANPGANIIDDTTGTLYVATNDRSLQVINVATCNAMVHTGCGQEAPETLGGNVPFSVAIDPATNTAYVGDSAEFDGFPAWTVSVLDTGTCNTLKRIGCKANPPTIKTQLNPDALAVDQATDTVYSTNLQDSHGNPGDTVAVINGATCNAEVITGCKRTPPTVKVGSGPFGIAVDQATDTIYVANSVKDTLSVIDGADCNAANSSGCDQATVQVPLVAPKHYGSTAVAVNQATNTVYVLNQGRPSTVSVLNGATCNATVTTGCQTRPPTVTVGNANGPAGLAVDDSTDTIYVDNTAQDTVSVINGATCNSTIVMGCGQTPAITHVGRQNFGYIAVDPRTGLVYVTDYLDDAVSIINGTDCNATDTAGCDRTWPMVPAGPSPTGIAVEPNTHDVYVTDNGGGPVSFFRFQSPASPTAVSVGAHHQRFTVSWQAPADGGLPIVYRVIPTPACPACRGLRTPTVSGLPETTITGLTPGRTYTFKVRATNVAGTSPASRRSHPITFVIKQQRGPSKTGAPRG
jgi:DNA-binding beta-propeller fold protein YncE